MAPATTGPLHVLGPLAGMRSFARLRPPLPLQPLPGSSPDHPDHTDCPHSPHHLVPPATSPHFLLATPPGRNGSWGCAALTLAEGTSDKEGEPQVQQDTPPSGSGRGWPQPCRPGLPRGCRPPGPRLPEPGFPGRRPKGGVRPGLPVRSLERRPKPGPPGRPPDPARSPRHQGGPRNPAAHAQRAQSCPGGASPRPGLAVTRAPAQPCRVAPAGRP